MIKIPPQLQVIQLNLTLFTFNIEKRLLLGVLNRPKDYIYSNLTQKTPILTLTNGIISNPTLEPRNVFLMRKKDLYNFNSKDKL